MTLWFWGWKPDFNYGRNKKKKDPSERKPFANPHRHIEPEEGEEFVPKPRVKRTRRRSKDPRASRLSPSQRPGARFVSVTVPVDAYVKLKEIAAFRKVSMGKVLSDVLDPVFDEVYKESMLLLRIEQNREKEREKVEAQRRANAARKSDV